MAFKLKYFGPLSVGQNASFTIDYVAQTALAQGTSNAWVYNGLAAGDAQAQMSVSDYFLPIANQLQLGDFILASGTDVNAVLYVSSVTYSDNTGHGAAITLTDITTGGGTGTVTAVNTGAGLTGGPITTTGTISLANTAVTPGAYTYASVTVDQQGRLTSASSGTAPTGTVTSVSGTTNRVTSTGGTTPVIDIAATYVGQSSITTIGTLPSLTVTGNSTSNNFIDGYATTVNASAKTTLTVNSAQQQFFTGSTIQTVVLPVVSTLTLGHTFLIVNNAVGGTVSVTVESSGANTIQVLASGTQVIMTCIAITGTGASSWSAAYSSASGGVLSITGTTNQVIASAATGPVTLSLPQSIATSSAPTFSGATIADLSIAGHAITSINTNENVFIGPNGFGSVTMGYYDYVSQNNPGVYVNSSYVNGTVFSVATYHNNTTPAFISLLKSRAVAAGGFVAVQSGDIIGQIQFVADDATAYVNSAKIRATVTDTVSTGVVPSSLGFYTSTITGVETLAMTISSAQIVTLAHALPVGSGGLGITSTPSNGQIPIGNGSTYAAATLSTANSSTLGITNGSGSITLANNAPGLIWVNQATSASMVAGNGYIANGAVLVVTLTLPTTAAIGTVLSVCGNGNGGWVIAQNSGQNINVSNVSTTVGVVGTISSSNQYNSIDLVCTVANTTWVAVGAPSGAVIIV